jgi:recombination protein RecA
MAARAAVEALLKEKKLDRTLTSALPERLGEDAVAPLDSAAIDQALAGRDGLQNNAVGGGLPRGQVSEVVGPASSGRTSVAWAALAAATRRGESVALIDTFDRFDPPTAQACGIDLSRVLWVRGQAVSKTTTAIDPAWLPGVRAVNGPGTFVERVIDRAIKALNLVVQSGVCTLVVMDLVDVPAAALRRLPAATWFRVERAIEGSDTAVLILAAQPVARSSGGRSIALGADQQVMWTGDHDRSRRVSGVRSRAAISAARWSHSQGVTTRTAIVNAIHVEAGL